MTGVVQGVGFRPFVWRLATELGLAGRVRNVAGRVELDAGGPAAALDELTRRLTTDAPPRSRVDAVTRDSRRRRRRGPVALPSPFRIEESRGRIRQAPGVERHFPPDLATCPACLADLHDPPDRRHRYPFTNCTDCGPRATIIDDLPYDRAATTMLDFAMCPACAAEYADPADRRFHAEPIACPDCGPRPTYRRGARSRRPDRHPTSTATATRRRGRGRPARGPDRRGQGARRLPPGLRRDRRGRRRHALRDRKRRWAKPFAVMVADLAAARALADVDDVEAALLTGPRAPIVLLRPRPRPLTCSRRA